MTGARALMPARGMLDVRGQLVTADQRLFDLNARAGGRIGQLLAVPQLATIARLAQRLGIRVSRAIVAADGRDDLDLWVRADPVTPLAGPGGVSLTVTGWRPRPSWQPADPIDHMPGDFLRGTADILWETDAALTLTALTAAPHGRDAFAIAGLLGQPLTRMVVLGEDDAGTFPILTGLAQHRAFDDQPATVRQTGRSVFLSAVPRCDAGGAFAGFLGTARSINDAAPPAPQSDSPHDRDSVANAFALHLDQTLRAPLDRIIANADSMHAQSDGPLRREYADYAADIASAGRHLVGLVDDLVDLQAIERPEFTVHATAIDLADVARRAGNLLQIRATAARVRIDTPAAGEVLPATGDSRRALQVLVNLVANAVRYAPADGIIWVRAEREGGTAAIVVADQGKGIARADQARIFRKFERVDPREAGGSGLGLYIARRLARAMGGDVTVDSAPGQGARFVFSLPFRGDGQADEQNDN